MDDKVTNLPLWKEFKHCKTVPEKYIYKTFRFQTSSFLETLIHFMVAGELFTQRQEKVRPTHE